MDRLFNVNNPLMRALSKLFDIGWLSLIYVVFCVPLVTIGAATTCWEAEKNLRTTPGSDCALNTLAIDEPLEYARLYLDGNLQMWVDAEDSLTL